MTDFPAATPGTPHIASVVLNHKCFTDTVVNINTRVTAVVGAPGSGKSTLLGQIQHASWNEAWHARFVFVQGPYPVGDLLREVASTDGDLYEEVSQWVSKILPRIARVDCWNGLTETLRDGREVSAGGTTIAVTRWIVGLLTNRGTPRVVLFDTDMSWHPETEKLLIAAIREICAQDPGLQVVLATNSPYMLDGFALEEVLVLAQDDAGRSHVRHLSEHPEAERHRHFLGTGEFWTSVGERWVIPA